MNNTKKEQLKLELLAPAKDLDTGKRAVLAGADAVYIGGPNFGARSAANNSWSDIQALVNFAHQYYVRVYLALNTIFFDDEKEAVKEAIWKAYELGVDAIIIQDMGILEMDLPPIPIHASTQTNNYDLEQIKFLEKAGFSRVVLARELNLSQLTEISKNSKIELEFFVHGALCVSRSGRCYFSEVLSGRSANRGKCQQVCRLPFSLIDADGQELASEKYLLSPKDLNLIDSLAELAEAGITSFKIEGRLKDPVYVTNVVARYREELDKIITASGGKYVKASSGVSDLNFKPDLAKTFNRGYTDYFLNGRHGEIISPENQKSLGKFIGKVKRVDHRYFTLDRQFKLSNGDGLCWLNPRGGLCGTNVNLISDDGKIYPNKWIPLKPGTLIYCNQDQSFEKAVLTGVNRFLNFAIEVSDIPVGWSIKATDEDGNQVELKIKVDKVVAEKPDQAKNNWENQFNKTGETFFKLTAIKFNWEKPGFVPVSVLNQWRRELVDQLIIKRLENYPREIIPFKLTNHAYPVKELDYSHNISNSLARAFYARHKSVVKEQALELQDDKRGKKIMITKHCLRYFLQACPRRVKKDSPKIKEPLFLVYNGKKYPLKFNCDSCEMEIYNN